MFPEARDAVTSLNAPACQDDSRPSWGKVSSCSVMFLQALPKYLLHITSASSPESSQALRLCQHMVPLPRDTESLESGQVSSGWKATIPDSVPQGGILHGLGGRS